MPLLPRKAPFRCPHCGFVQDESEHLISTYCRGCGSHYEVLANSPSRTLPDRFHRARSRTWRRVSLVPGRKIRCHRCGKVHEVSGHARTTFCPRCGTAIDLCDETISSSISRPIDTRGNLIITPSGYVCSALTVCCDALVAGRISGTLVCEATLRLACSERLSCQMNARSIVIEYQARLELIYPVRTGDLTVHGQAAGNFECTGSIWIARGGLIEGRISASSVIVEPGGTLLAESSVRPVRNKEPVEHEDEAGFFTSAGHPLPAY
jgi:cytoskeletal protein CcmA (bactofilin family)/DNA-directed RNA polymerase subunit RPC12/RpoP